jgi:uncharacterized protein (DUF2252 family)
MTKKTLDIPPPVRMLLPAETRHAAAKALRENSPRSAHGKWKPPSKGRDVIGMLKQSSVGRIPELVPIRYGRMLQSPFAFLRGSASIMAYDLSRTATSGIRTQVGGDCHLMNFGEFGTPERNLVFDINDFDETLPGPWEWDLKRLVASVMVAGRHRKFSENNNRKAVLAAVRSYRTKMAVFAGMSPLQCWYSHINAEDLVNLSSTPAVEQRLAAEAAQARIRTGESILAKTTEIVDGKRRIKDNPPLIFHPDHLPNFDVLMRAFFHQYRLSLPDDRRHLLDRYELTDIAMKVIGVGSVGTRCSVALFMEGEHDPLFLQFKEARSSVLEPYVGKSAYQYHGRRVVEGQRLMQSSSDIFLGWARHEETGIDYYIRQLRDMKNSIDIESIALPELIDYAGFCGWALARAHAKAGDAVAISGYLGKSDVFDLALAEFAKRYADQTEADYSVMAKAAASGRLNVLKE